jgi:hypothetical protein
MNKDLAAALEPLRSGFQADGADLDLVDVRDGMVVVRLLITDPSCDDECILPKRTLESILLTTLRRADPTVRNVEVLDPRVEDSG